MTCDDLMELHSDYICLSCTCYDNQKQDLDSPTAHLPVRTECHRAKKPVIRGHTKASQESSANNSIKIVQLKKKIQTSAAFEHVDKKRKVSKDRKSVKMEDAIIAAFTQVNNSNANISISSP